MALPSTNLSLDDIYQESTPGFSSARNFSNVSFKSWAQGPLGSNTYTYNGYGLDGSGGGVPTGGNIIYNFTSTSTGNLIKFGDFRSKQYYFDGSTFDIKYSYNNTKNNIPFPPPGQNNDVNVQIDCKDYSNTYNVHNSFNVNVPGGTSAGATQMPGFSPNSFPLVKNVYWTINITTIPGNGIGNIAFSVNGTTVYNAGAGGGNFTWQSAGASAGTTNGSGIVYDIYVT